MGLFNIYYKMKLGPSSFESIIANTEEEALEKFRKQYPTEKIEYILKPRMGDRR
jgi:hypothetical protein